MTERLASCSCGAVTARCTGEPVRASVCHCNACKRRSGSAFAYNLTFRAEQVEKAGTPRSYTRSSDEGRWGTHYFCAECGGTVWYEIEARPGMVSVPGGAFADTTTAEPTASVYSEIGYPWVALVPSGPLERE